MNLPLLRTALLLLLIALSRDTNAEGATAPETPGPADEIARVGHYPILVADLEQAVNAIFGDDATPANRSRAELDVAVDALIAARVLVLEAERRGVDQEAGLLSTLDSLRAILLREAIYERDVYADLAPPPEEDLAALYEEWGRGELVQGAHILLRTRQEAGEMIDRLEEGVKFVELARSHSQHAASQPHGGVMGYLRRSQYPPALAEAIWPLGVGDHGLVPVHTAMGWHVVLAYDRRTLTIVEQRPALVDECERRQRQRAEDRFRAELRASYEVVYHSETTAAVAALQDTLSGERPLYTWRGGRLDLAGFLRRVQVPDPVSQDTARMRRLASGLVFDELAARAAETRGYMELRDIRKKLRDKRFRIIGEHLFKAETTPEPGREDVLACFEERRELFRSHQSLTVREILVDEAATADSLYRLVVAGQDMAELAREHSVRTDLASLGGLWEDVRPRDPRSGKIYVAGLESGPGLHPPLKVPGGYSVFEVLDIQKGRLLNFEEAEASARSGLAGFRMETLIKRLRMSLEDQIWIDVARLDILAGSAGSSTP